MAPPGGRSRPQRRRPPCWWSWGSWNSGIGRCSRVLDGAASVTDVARRYGVGRQTVHTWLRRYAAEGLLGLADRSSRPSNCPHQMPPAVEARVVEMRRQHRGWGPRTILSRLPAPASRARPSRRTRWPRSCYRRSATSSSIFLTATSPSTACGRGSRTSSRVATRNRPRRWSASRRLIAACIHRRCDPESRPLSSCCRMVLGTFTFVVYHATFQ